MIDGTTAQRYNTQSPPILILSKDQGMALRSMLRQPFDKLRVSGLWYMIALLSIVGALLLAPAATAQSGLPPAPYAYQQLSDPTLEAEARTLMHTLRCLVCQGQSIADSDAPLAGDMRSQVRERLLAGEQPEAIRAWLVSRYGSWVSYEPPLGADTFLLYLAPLIALIAGIWIAFGRMRWRRDALPSEESAA